MIVLALLLLMAHSVACQDDGTTSFYLFLSRNESIIERQSRMPSSEGEECFVGSKNNLKCLCGDNLTTAHREYRQSLLDTCTNNFTEDSDSVPFSFCSAALLSLGYNIEVINNTNDSMNMVDMNYTFNSYSLAERIESLEQSMLVFQRVLDRTIVGVLVETKGHLCSCLVRFIYCHFCFFIFA